MTYASPAGAFITKSNMRLQAVQNRALGLVGVYDRYTRFNKIHSDLKIMKLKSFISKVSPNIYSISLCNLQTLQTFDCASSGFFSYLLTLTLTPWLMEPVGPMPHSQGLSNNSYPEPNQPNYPHWYLSLQGPF